MLARLTHLTPPCLSVFQLFPHYKGTLLLKAIDLAQRLRPAFDSPSRLPYLFVNLQKVWLADQVAHPFVCIHQHAVNLQSSESIQGVQLA